EANVLPSSIDLIAVANRPGLMGPLLIGLNTAKALSFAWSIPYVTVNHLEAHLYASMMLLKETILFPALGVVISGGHTFMLRIDSFRNYQLISSTVDDAIGESFDKVASLLDLPYPGGPEIEKLAKEGDPTKYPFKAGIVKKDPLSFSFSGLKTQVLYAIKGMNGNKKGESQIDPNEKKHIAASFQITALSDIVKKALKAATLSGASQIFLGGGVSNSSKLKELFTLHAPPTLSIHFPPKNLSIDNGAMIAGLGYHIFTKNFQSDSYAAVASPSGSVLFD
ncbi:MAG: tRNA (adenosine(37)-N6)-threonylcarbamoyltransferase complex transferase subunit TsaD, partial [Simkaniaceae bacterium]|nr:tRNA (adenosine(37)-N6)-threonylcarbamoyltransferase complex transferase subunit TsaD [Simkaniaceae bacterium]